MENKKYYCAYEKRYKAVYDAGAEFWGHTPDDEELKIVLEKWIEDNNLKNKKIIEFACGEGAAGVILSKLGCEYLGIDISPSAIRKAKSILNTFPNAKVELIDMVDQKLTDEYDAALDVMGFHMLITDIDRIKYLKNAQSCLKNGSPMLFFRELYDNNAYDGLINDFDEWLKVTGSDYNTPRQMSFQKDGKDTEIYIPYVPGRTNSKNGYLKEMKTAGFIVDNIFEMPTSRKVPHSVSIYVHKP